MTTQATVSLKFLLAHPAHFFALGLGSGLAPVAPGTFGTLAALPLWLLVADAGFCLLYTSDAADEE